MSDLSAAFARLDAYAEERRQAYNTPGLALAVTDRSGLLHAAGFGYADIALRTPATTDTIFAIGSMGKAFTATALLREYERGRLDLDAPVTRYLPWVRAGSEYDPISIHHLLTHTAGLIASSDATPDARSEVWALRQTQYTSPGEQFHYSDVGYKVLGLVLEALTGQEYGAAIQTAILDPLGMTATLPILTHAVRPRMAVGYRPLYDDRPASRRDPLVPAPWVETDTGDGSLAASITDLAAFVRMLLNGGQGPRGQVLAPESFARLTGRFATVDEDEFYGYGIFTRQLDGRTVLYHGGDIPGYEGLFLADPAAGLGFAALINGPGRPYAVGRYALQLLRAVANGDQLPEPPASNDPLHIPDVAAYAGTYRAADQAITLVAEGEALTLRHDGEEVRLEIRAPDAFYVDHPAFARFLLRVQRDEDDKVIALAHGGDWFTHERYPPADPARAPASWAGYTGHYRSHNPWLSNFRIVLRNGRLVLIYPGGDEEPLVHRYGRRFRVGPPYEDTPEEIRFYAVVGGQALHAVFSGATYYRFFTP